MANIWPDTFVEEVTLARTISDLRKVLGDGVDGERLIETVPKYGYRFVAPVMGTSTSAHVVLPEGESGRRSGWSKWSFFFASLTVLGASVYLLAGLGGIHSRAIVASQSALSRERGVPPQGWLTAGSKPLDYETGLDSQTKRNGQATAYLKSNNPQADGFGTLTQTFEAQRYLGRRVRFSGYVKSEGVVHWAGLWMRINNSSRPVAFDNMEDRPIKGTTTWHPYEIVLDVPRDAEVISIGILLAGTGSIWLDSANFEIVPTSIPTTSLSPPTGPKNLNFQK
jgi:hypothetical protein